MLFLWSQLVKVHLTQNMIAMNDPHFCEYILRIGNREEQIITENWITIPENMIIPFTDIAILTAKNEHVNKINEIIINEFAGEHVEYYSFDSLIKSHENTLVNTDFLNDLSRLPPHKLILKENCPIILLQNLDHSSGLSNGSRLICKKFSKNVIDSEIITRNYKGTRILLPRISLQSQKYENFHFNLLENNFQFDYVLQ
ncbi:ATP-dependent DNA helicase PIF1 [Apostasia shenzhenica]|uniref:ATP-dependent DNA helicase PIF1 n=1 Tax=Apostasia shenzhenica TaxID=1088818 RepID=A0A2I0BA81_9ASPA|nr:ATP-dependent DNA helicase PIF1 [Apostasia shenzhenica]